ncbi:LOW QUALITY PROTEIN: hypothetical protein V2J09_011162 [Rumex salicifolius]
MPCESLGEELDAIIKIKSIYTLSKNWQGDPCVPQSYMWDGVNCSFINPITPVIIALDMSNNSLNGDISESLMGLTSLTVLNLVRNNLTGTVPQYLLDKSAKGQLVLSMSGKPDHCASSLCSKKKKSFIIPVVASIGALLCLVAVLGVVFLIMKWKPEQQVKQQQGPSATKNKGGLSRFSYSEVKKMTGDFKRQLGKGEFGLVYYGCLKDGTEVVVKKLYSKAHSLEQFETENLVSLIGYMALGDLKHVLIATEETPNGFRLQSLQHKYSLPSDFTRSYVSTRVIGTPGYLDPRPTMSHVVTELKVSLAMEMDVRSQGDHSSTSTSIFDSVELDPVVCVKGMASTLLENELETNLKEEARIKDNNGVEAEF